MVIECGGWGCDRLISISTVPGGNPVALSEPDAWAIEFSICEDCKEPLCDRCTRKRTRGFRAVRCPWCHGGLIDGRHRWEEVTSRPYPEAITRYEEGLALAEAGRIAEAMPAFDSAVRLRPTYVLAHFHRGIALGELGRNTEALEALDEASRLDLFNPLASFEKGAIHEELSQPQQAIKAYDEAIRREPRYIAPRINKAVMLNELAQWDEALAVCDDTIRIIEADQGIDGAEHAYAHIQAAKGACLLNLRRDEEGLAALDVAIANGPDDPLTYRNRGIALERLGRHEEARLSLRIAEECAEQDN
ncbi:hypothetical protein ADK65_14045 [Streptomyces sp. NRRL B-1140]|uniref:tetratricopeptide repeat protein n=1 Tax=Streptomyces sp. NRRL B-1140 TaxID=1415549 RepID=UPI0006C4ECF5|nr:tetratricopeptide repeat protein [Streptomyces sp. NRRL B-1140]KOX00739.1 hypothetical protein ADK65_14045 [Streptomyces sp. NRRL B-1140]